MDIEDLVRFALVYLTWGAEWRQKLRLKLVEFSLLIDGTLIASKSILQEIGNPSVLVLHLASRMLGNVSLHFDSVTCFNYVQGWALWSVEVWTHDLVIVGVSWIQNALVCLEFGLLQIEVVNHESFFRINFYFLNPTFCGIHRLRFSVRLQPHFVFLVCFNVCHVDSSFDDGLHSSFAWGCVRVEQVVVGQFFGTLEICRYYLSVNAWSDFSDSFYSRGYFPCRFTIWQTFLYKELRLMVAADFIILTVFFLTVHVPKLMPCAL